MGLPHLEALRANRMPNRWLACGAGAEDSRPAAHALCCEPEYLPFADQSLDLVVLPHTLERAEDPHRSLAEVERVLRPEGRVVIVGLNPVSLWGLRQRGGGWRAGPGCGASSPAICRRVRSGSATGGCGIGCAC
jgi:SAM-dependent methyltransferase